jgi:hypothetical protein
MLARSQVAAAHAQAHQSLMAALVACPAQEGQIKRWWVEAEQVAHGKPGPVKMIVFTRTQRLFDLVADRSGWSAGRIR